MLSELNTTVYFNGGCKVPKYLCENAVHILGLISDAKNYYHYATISSLCGAKVP